MTHDAASGAAPLAAAKSGWADAIVVPASRGASTLDAAARLAIRLNASLVALCSKKTRMVDVATRLARMRGCRALVIEVPKGYRHDLLPARTAGYRFRVASANRRSDLSLKRNLGLLLARLHGWRKILFLDDDIAEHAHGKPIGLPVETAYRLVAELDNRPIAGMTCRQFPDNSVVCHARRLAGFPQDTFVSGSALGVNCSDQPLSFFPDQYNEDWYFFSRQVADRSLGLVGGARQAAYDPFATTDRAREEEFGDVLAEGLFTLFDRQPPEMNYHRRLDAANATYWEAFLEARREMLGLIGLSLESARDYDLGDAERCAAALRSVAAAQEQLSRLTPHLCADYLNAWGADLSEWERTTLRISGVGDTAEALDILGLKRWRLVGHRKDHTSLRPLIGVA